MFIMGKQLHQLDAKGLNAGVMTITIAMTYLHLAYRHGFNYST